jgi:hypothetical protein
MSATGVSRWEMFDEDEAAVIAIALATPSPHLEVWELRRIAGKLLIELGDHLGMDAMPGGEEALAAIRLAIEADGEGGW